jgi:dipeptidyl aminopeptidase/acylaminoacyl peptidase
MPSYAGVSLATPLFSSRYRRLLGVRYVTDGPHEYWFAPELRAVQQQFQQLYPKLVSLIVSTDADVRRLLVLSYSARDPGFYSLVDLADGKLRQIGRRCPWINPDHMADTYPVSCEARDGLTLRGYLTLPAGRGRQNLPLVTLVHGGPWRRDVWGFDAIVQFLANRGYAVLQVNYRGSPGYGRKFSEKGRKEIGGRIQDDIVDMTLWAVRQGIADASRLAIMGSSYGGYSTLFALGRQPEVFRCGIAIAPVTDWVAIWRHRENDMYKDAFRFWSERIGNMEDEAVRSRLAEVSPINFAASIRAPLLLVHGKRDTTVPLAQSESLVEALARTNHPAKALFFSDLGHRYPDGEQGTKFLTEVEQFLGNHLGATR